MRRILSVRMFSAIGIFAGICLAAAFLPSIRPTMGKWLVLVSSVVIAFGLLAAYWDNAALWWLLPFAGIVLGLALSVVLAALLPGLKLLTSIGLVLAWAALALGYTAGNPSAPDSLLALSGAAFFISLVFLLTGLGYAVWIVSLLLFALGFDLAVTSLYLPGLPLRGAALLVSLVGTAISPQPLASLRILIPSALAVAGLALIQKGRTQANS